MKTFIALLFISITVFAQTPKELQWIDTQLKDIKKTRKGISPYQISLLADPFVFLSKNKTKQDGKKESVPAVVPKAQTATTNATAQTNTQAATTATAKKKTYIFKLHAIMNKSALIDNKWYKVGDKVHGYTITRITLQDVILVNGMKRKILTTNTHRMKK